LGFHARIVVAGPRKAKHFFCQLQTRPLQTKRKRRAQITYKEAEKYAGSLGIGASRFRHLHRNGFFPALSPRRGKGQGLGRGPGAFPLEIKKRLRLVAQTQLHAEDEIHWELWKSGCVDQWPLVRGLLLKNMPTAVGVASRSEAEEQIDDFPYHHGALRLRRDPFAGIKRALRITSNKVFDRVFQEVGRYLLSDLLPQDPQSEESARGAREFDEAVGKDVSDLHRRMVAQGLADPERLKANLARVDASEAMKLAVRFKRLEDKPEYRSMLESVSGISERQAPDGGEARWAARATVACLLVARSSIEAHGVALEGSTARSGTGSPAALV
jgi:hypothetical protein